MDHMYIRTFSDDGRWGVDFHREHNKIMGHHWAIIKGKKVFTVTRNIDDRGFIGKDHYNRSGGLILTYNWENPKQGCYKIFNRKRGA
jgi:hypothetical protein